MSKADSRRLYAVVYIELAFNGGSDDICQNRLPILVRVCLVLLQTKLGDS